MPYIVKTLSDIPLALSIASNCNLPGAEELFVRQFNNCFSTGDYQVTRIVLFFLAVPLNSMQGAARVAAESPGTVLRNMQTIQRFKQCPTLPNQVRLSYVRSVAINSQVFVIQPSPLLQYFSILLEKGKLQSLESLELARPVLQQGRGQLLERWLQEDKLECSEELGDFVRQFDMKMALNIYFRANAHQKVTTSKCTPRCERLNVRRRSFQVVMCFVESGQFEKIVAYAQRTGFQPEWSYLLQNCLSMNPQAAVPFAQMLLSNEEVAAKVDINSIVDTFLNRGMVQEVTSLLLDYLVGDKTEHAALQTRLLEINLMQAPQVADKIMTNEMFSQYDRQHIGQLCEKAGLYQRALEHYTEVGDIKRCLLNTHAISPDFIVQFFSKLSVEDSLDVLNSMLKSNRAQNMQICVQVAAQYSEQLTPQSLIDLFQTNEAWEGMYYYLGQIINFSQDEQVHFKYIESAARINQLQDVERIVRESNYYNAEEVKEFLKGQRLADQVPLIIVCDRFNYVDDLTQFLYKNNMNRYIEVYVSKVNPSQTPVVVGSLLDVDCNEDYIRHLVKMVGTQCPVTELVAEVEKRNRLKLILNWLEERVADGNTEPATHNALAKIYIDSNRDAENFLLTNEFYDSKEIGEYCESRDPHLSVIAYKRGQCDMELVDVTNRNGLFRQQARYVTERQDPELWAHVLREDNEYRRSVIDQVVQTALPETKVPEEVSSTVKAFMTADIPNELIELLEKIVLESSEFAGNRNLQNLLIFQAIKADKARVMDYVNRLDNYNASDIANIAIHSELYEEAFAVFKKFNHNVQAIEVLIDNLDNVERAYDWAERVNEPEVYSKLGSAQLKKKMVKEAIDSFIKSDDPQYFQDVIAAAEEVSLYDHLVRYLQMCRKKLKEPRIETELIWAWANCKQLADLEDFIQGPNCANIQVVGDRCFSAGLYEAAKILFNNVSNFSRLATTLVKLKEFSAGVDAARKANSQRTWKEVNQVCVEEGEFKLAQICGLHIIVHADELEQLIYFYENLGHFDALLQLVEAGLALERAHVGMFTELAILYSKYKPEKLMDHLRLYYTRMNIPKVLRACERNNQWPELAFLYIHYDEHDNAALTMINHPIEAWEHGLFKEVIPKVASLEICYKAIEFYLREHPLMTNDLLKTLTSRVDHTRVVNLVRKLGHLAVIKPYLLSVQEENVSSVNAALHDLYIEEEDFEGLRDSITRFSNFDSLELAVRLEKHDMLEFRRLAVELFRQNKRFAQSLELSKKDMLWKDAIDTVAASRKADLVEELLRFFVAEGRKDCFASCLFTCYDFVPPDVVLELAWRNGMTDFAMPYMIQMMKEYSTRLASLEAAVQPPASQDGQSPSAGGAGQAAAGGIPVHGSGMPVHGSGMIGNEMQSASAGPGMFPAAGGGMMPMNMNPYSSF